MDMVDALNKRDEAIDNESRFMVFDWDKAARIIKERKPLVATAGLKNDWEWTGGVIYEHGEIVKDSYTYLASLWATPELSIDGEIIDCFVYEDECSHDWDAETKWPPSALKILKGE